MPASHPGLAGLFVMSLVVANNAFAAQPDVAAAATATVTAQDLDAAIAGFQAYYAQGHFQYVAQARELSCGVYGPATAEGRWAQAQALRQQMAADGTWPDLNYQDQNRTFWQVQQHANRAVVLAAAACSAMGSAPERAALAQAANHAIAVWRERQFRNTNWWYNDFGAPLSLGTASILLGEALSAENRAFVIRLTHDIKHAGFGKVGGGGNQVWSLSRNLMSALLAKDTRAARQVADALWLQTRQPVTVPDAQRAPGGNGIEGVQPDQSLHQHGPQMQFGNYGLSFAIDLAAWAAMLRGTALAMPPERFAELRQYLLDGQTWVYWRGRIDISGVGRRFCPQVQTAMYAMVCQPLADLADIDPTSAEAVRAFTARHQPGAINDHTGFRWFWRSDYGIARHPGFFASVRLHSPHTVGWERCNGENLQGWHLADGATYLSARGDEYDEIFPVWDWRRLPGITTTATPALESLVGASPAPRPVTAPLPPPEPSPIMAGGVTLGDQGCMAYQHASKDTQVTARKAWFTDRNILVCLGAGITGAATGPAVITSVNQCLGRGPVRVSAAGRSTDLTPGALAHVQAEAIDHDGLRYEFPSGGDLWAGITTQTGTWHSVSSVVSSPLEPQSRPVLSLLFHHGAHPSAGTYAYAVRPAGTAAPAYRIVANTPDVQAVAWDDQRSAVVFWRAGSLTWAPGHTLTASAPCLIAVQRGQIAVSDPTWTLTTITLHHDGTPLTVDLPTAAGMAGSTVIVRTTAP